MNKKQINQLTEGIYNVLTEKGVLINPSMADKVYNKYHNLLDSLVKKITKEFNLHPSVTAVIFSNLFGKYYGGRVAPKGFFDETIKKSDSKYVVYPQSGGKRLGTHDTKKVALKQLAAIEISKHKKG